MYALEDHLALGAFHVKHAFVAQHARAEHLHQAAQEFVQPCRVERARALEHEGGDVVAVMRVVMIVLVVVPAGFAMLVVVAAIVAVLVFLGVEEGRVDLELVVQVEAAQVEHV
jgi:hypothetical protein